MNGLELLPYNSYLRKIFNEKTKNFFDIYDIKCTAHFTISTFKELEFIFTDIFLQE